MKVEVVKFRGGRQNFIDPCTKRQMKRGVAGIANIQASCGQQFGNCISEYCLRISHLSEFYDLELLWRKNICVNVKFTRHLQIETPMLCMFMHIYIYILFMTSY